MKVERVKGKVLEGTQKMMPQLQNLKPVSLSSENNEVRAVIYEVTYYALHPRVDHTHNAEVGRRN